MCVRLLDFLQISEDKPVVIEIPVKLVGFAEGVKAGGRLSLEQRKLRVKALPGALPDTLDVNIDERVFGKSESGFGTISGRNI